MMLDRVVKRVNIISLSMWIIFGLFLVVLYITTLSGRNETLTNRKNGLVNQTYVRVIACLTSESPDVRTADYTNYCYAKAEQETGVKVEHYGKAE